MAEPTETPKILEELSKSNAANPKSPSSRQKNKALRRFGIVVILFLPILAGILFVAYQQITLQSQLAALQLENQQLSQDLTQQNSRLQQVVQDQLNNPVSIEVDDSAIRELETNVSSVGQQIRQMTLQISELENRQQIGDSEINQEWKILEAEYLLGIANQKLQLESDLAAAVFLLGQADQALLASGSNNVFTVREAIASELLILQNVEVLDREGIYLRLNNLVLQTQAIDLLSSMRQNFESRRGDDSQPVQIGTDTAGIIDSSLEFLSSIFVWRQWDETPEAMLAPGQDVLIKQNLSLMLEQAQLALLMRDNNLYQQSLTKSKDWLLRYAVIDSTAGQALTLELNQLIDIDIDPLFPALTQSISLISQLTANER